MDEGIAAFLIVCVSVFGVIGLNTYSGIRDNEAMLAMVEKGADPQKAACAIKGSTEINKQVCHVIAKNGNS